MTFATYLAVLRNGWKILACATIAGLVVASAYLLIRPPQYTAETQLYVSTRSADNLQQAYQGAQLSEQRVASYTKLATSPRILDETIAQLRLPETPEDLARHITASASTDSVVIEFSVTDESDTRSAEIANAWAGSFIRLVAELEAPDKPGTAPPVVIKPVQAAPVPDQPSSTPWYLTLVLGCLGGFAAGVCLVLVRNVLDTTIRSIEELRELTSAAIIATVPQVPSEDGDAALVMTRGDGASPAAEAYRQARTNVQFLTVDAESRVFALSSPMPGEGKTTATANLAIALASAGHRVIAIDADLRRPTLASTFGFDSSVGLTTVLAGRTAASSAIQQWKTPTGPAVQILASGPIPPNPSELLSSTQMAKVIVELASAYDYVLLDTPPILPVADTLALAANVNGIIMVSRFGSTSRHGLKRAVDAVEAGPSPLVGNILNMIPWRDANSYGQVNYYRYGGTTTEPAAEDQEDTTTNMRRPGATLPPRAAQHQPSPTKRA